MPYPRITPTLCMYVCTYTEVLAMDRGGAGLRVQVKLGSARGVHERWLVSFNMFAFKVFQRFGILLTILLYIHEHRY